MEKLKRFVFGGLGLGVIFLALVAVYFHLRIPALFIEKVKIDSPRSALAPLSPVDGVLLENRRYLSRNKRLLDRLDHPPLEVRIAGLFVDRFEVSQGDFDAFAKWANRRKVSLMPFVVPDDWVYGTASSNHLIFGKDASPASGVAFYDALGYCQAAGGRLPTAEEWNAAASGKENRVYPWGFEFIQDAWIFPEKELNAVHQRNSLSEMSTREGLEAMGHNVSEWTTGRFPEGLPAVSGGDGSNAKPSVESFSFVRREVAPTFRSGYVGFRCVYDTAPSANPWEGTLETAFLEAGTYSVGLPKGTLGVDLLRSLSPEDAELLPQMLMKGEEENGSSFLVSKFEITVEQYVSFLGDPFVKMGLYSNSKEPRSESHVPDDWERQRENPDQPVRGVSWWAAYAFSQWAGGRLPTENEWLAVFRGDGNRIYLGGPEYVPGSSLGREIGWGEALPVGTMERDSTHHGVADMMGNVSEWTQSAVIRKNRLGFVVKGGSYLLPSETAARIDYRRVFPPEAFADDVGFRLVFDG